jgi:hypothetical protein
VARPLGLVVQPSLEQVLSELEGDGATALSRPRVIHTDVDMRDFSPETLDFLRRVSQVFASGDLTTGVSRAHELSKRFDARAGARILRDLLERRNDHLVDQLDAALPQHRSIIVPWGALHLPTIERALVERGFERTSEHSRRFVRYATLLGALTSMRSQGHSLSGGTLERE